MEKKSLMSSRFAKLTAIAALALALVLTLVVALQPAAAFADESSSSAAKSKLSSAVEEKATEANSDEPVNSDSDAIDVSDSDKPHGGLPMMGNDYVWFGRSLVLSKADIANDLIAAGEEISLKDVSAMGDFRVAGQDITIKDSYAFENMTVAGQTVRIQDSDATAVVAAGSTVAYSGTCDELTIYAEKVYIDGTVYGDVVVGANKVEVGTNARIMGTMRVEASSDPVMQRGAEVKDVDFTKTEGSSSMTDVNEALTEMATTMTIVLTIFGIIGTLIIAVLAEWLFRRQTAAAAEMIRNRTGATIGTGVVAAIVAPLVIILLMCLGVTLPVAGALIFALLAMTMVASGFAGASLFKLAFPKLGRFKCALAGGAIMGVAGAIPFLGAIVGVLAFMYLLGYVLQSIFLGMKDPAPTTPAPLGNGPEPAGPTGDPVPPIGFTQPVEQAAAEAPTAPVVPVNDFAQVAPTERMAPAAEPVQVASEVPDAAPPAGEPVQVASEVPDAAVPAGEPAPVAPVMQESDSAQVAPVDDPAQSVDQQQTASIAPDGSQSSTDSE